MVTPFDDEGLLDIDGALTLESHLDSRVTQGDALAPSAPLDHDRARSQPARGQRHRAVTKPAIRGVGVAALRTGPLGELHAL
jgi:hypothetical protein